MVTISLSCGAGTHAIGVETTSHSDSNGLSSDPYQVYVTSAGLFEHIIEWYAVSLYPCEKNEDVT